MENTDSTLELQKLILEFNKNPENQKLIDYYTSKTYFEILSKPRSETVHSSFLAWILESKDFSTGVLDSPIMGLLDIISEKRLASNDDYRYEFPDGLLKNVLSRYATVTIDSVTLEECLPDIENKEKNKEKNKKENRFDIILRCTVNNYYEKDRKNNKLLIVIENKIGSKESSKTDKNNKTIWQTERYFDSIMNSDKGKEKYHESYKIFVFLTPPDADNPQCNEFVHITYQDIMDRILDPLSNSSKLSDKARLLIQDYIKTLSVPAINEDSDDDNKNYSVLAVGKEERDKLSKFAYNSNKLITSLFENYTNPIVGSFREKYKHLLEAVLNILKTQEIGDSLQNSINDLEYLCTSGTHIVSIYLKNTTNGIKWKVGKMIDISKFIILELWEYYNKKGFKDDDIFDKISGIVNSSKEHQGLVTSQAQVLYKEMGKSKEVEISPKNNSDYKVYVRTQWYAKGSKNANTPDSFEYEDDDVKIQLKILN